MRLGFKKNGRTRESYILYKIPRDREKHVYINTSWVWDKRLENRRNTMYTYTCTVLHEIGKKIGKAEQTLCAFIHLTGRLPTYHSPAARSVMLAAAVRVCGEQDGGGGGGDHDKGSCLMVGSRTADSGFLVMLHPSGLITVCFGCVFVLCGVSWKSVFVRFFLCQRIFLMIFIQMSVYGNIHIHTYA